MFVLKSITSYIETVKFKSTTRPLPFPLNLVPDSSLQSSTASKTPLVRSLGIESRCNNQTTKILREKSRMTDIA